MLKRKIEKKAGRMEDLTRALDFDIMGKLTRQLFLINLCEHEIKNFELQRVHESVLPTVPRHLL